ncbi:MAG: FAD-binding protein [Oscillospiraceae bacterium]|nr:FAD-binding protein [Oscillospiraceae bacterium]
MKIVVCIRRGLDGEINPFDACAYEAALKVSGAEVTLLSMGPLNTRDFLLGLTRLGAKEAVLLSDSAFAGADTLATAYALSLAIKKIQPDLVFCGRQTLVGDTAQTGAMLSVYLDFSLATSVMSIDSVSEACLACTTRQEGEVKLNLPALLTVERINTLRLPSIMSKMGRVEVWSAADVGADIGRCGLQGSPTRVVETFENTSGRRRCTFVEASELKSIVSKALSKQNDAALAKNVSDKKLNKVFSVGKEPLEYAQSVCDNVKVIDRGSEAELAELIKKEAPDAVIWASDGWSKRVSARVAALLNLGLCADCTALETDGETLYMIRPALAGSVIAKVKSLTKPAMATVRTTSKDTADVIVAAGFGAKNCIEKVKALSNSLSGELASSRKLVDNGILPYSMQVGLTGKTVCPAVYVAVGVSGAVHHIVGMQQAGVVIAINPDKDAPIFDYADYGILSKIEDIEL